MTESRNSRWRSSKPEVHLFQLVEELPTQFQIIIPCCWGRAIQWWHSQHCHTTMEVGIQDGPSKPEVPIFQLVEELATRFQILIPCFRGRAIKWRHFKHCHSTWKSESKMAVVKTRSTYISACGGACKAISNHNTTFSGSGNSVAPLPTLLSRFYSLAICTVPTQTPRPCLVK